MIQDRLSDCLQADGFVLESRRLNPDNPDSMEVGYRFLKDGVEFVCRVDETDPATVILVFYGLACLGTRSDPEIKHRQDRPTEGPSLGYEKREDASTLARLSQKRRAFSRGLKTGFAELMWLLNYLKSKGFARIKGYIWADPKLYPDTASMQRMQLFYDRMGAKLEEAQSQDFIVYTLKPINRFRDLMHQAS
jgi:hypothetical protein